MKNRNSISNTRASYFSSVNQAIMLTGPSHNWSVFLEVGNLIRSIDLMRVSAW